ncbi:hypothetical protein RND71_021744 [Anisodus tanguticus]|uniref:Ycf2 N-terminal domain-containing protein n=1 Tax=Anisodus tanguticus TaxID=243964 RepID=A0AAE1VGE3_9SOLA|nr:hypothetical protein RND71_021744 [Anisodus tanguticus]
MEPRAPSPEPRCCLRSGIPIGLTGMTVSPSESVKSEFRSNHTSQYTRPSNSLREIESGRFPKCLSGYSSMSRLFTEREKQMIDHLFPEEIEEFLGNPTRSSLKALRGKLDQEMGRIRQKYEIPIVQRIRSVLLRTGRIDDQEKSSEEASFNAPQDKQEED